MKKTVSTLLIVIGCLALAAGAYAFGQYIKYVRLMRTYRLAYTDTVQRYAAEYELDPYLVTAVMRCESSNNPDAVSRSGAIGLMQVMPETGEWIAHKLDMDAIFDVQMLYEPDVSVRFGCWYLRFLTDRFEGDTMQIIAAYNAGHGNVEKWLEDERFSLDGKLTVIPFEETAQYYKRVMTAYDAYRTLYPNAYGPDASVADS